MTKRKTLTWRTIGLGLGVAVFMILAYFVLVYFQMNQTFARDKLPNDLPFEIRAWRDGTPRQRGQMLQQLLDDVGIRDKNGRQVDSLLGPPDGEWETGQASHPFCISYYVDEGGSLYASNMLIFIDSNDQVIDLFFDD